MHVWLSPSTGHKRRRKAGKDAAEAFGTGLENKDKSAGSKRLAARPYSSRISRDSESWQWHCGERDNPLNLTLGQILIEKYRCCLQVVLSHMSIDQVKFSRKYMSTSIPNYIDSATHNGSLTEGGVRLFSEKIVFTLPSLWRFSYTMFDHDNNMWERQENVNSWQDRK